MTTAERRERPRTELLHAFTPTRASRGGQQHKGKKDADLQQSDYRFLTAEETK